MSIQRGDNITDKTLEEYIKENHPLIISEYMRYINRHEFPKIGDKVRTLRAGFGSLYRRYLSVTNVDDNWITMIDENEIEFLCDKERWYKDIEVIQ